MGFKSKKLIQNGAHIVAHVYVEGMKDLTFKLLTNADEKSDDCPKFNGKPSWPHNILEEWKPRGNEPATKRKMYGGKMRAGEPDKEGFQKMSR